MIYELFHGLGPVIALLAVFLIFVIDAAIFPALPEVFAVLFFLANPLPDGNMVTWGVAILVMAILGEVAGNTLLYLFVNNILVKKKRMPRLLDRMMKRWVNFLIVTDEKIILVNRIAPVVPMVGAFIAVCEWSCRKSIWYVFLGSVAKYSFLLLLVGYFGITYERGTAQLIAVVAVLVIIGISGICSLVYRRKLMRQ